jgi:hypothetical protein
LGDSKLQTTLVAGRLWPPLEKTMEEQNLSSPKRAKRRTKTGRREAPRQAAGNGGKKFLEKGERFFFLSLSPESSLFCDRVYLTTTYLFSFFLYIQKNKT